MRNVSWAKGGKRLCGVWWRLNWNWTVDSFFLQGYGHLLSPSVNLKHRFSFTSDSEAWNCEWVVPRFTHSGLLLLLIVFFCFASDLSDYLYIDDDNVFFFFSLLLLLLSEHIIVQVVAPVLTGYVLSKFTSLLYCSCCVTDWKALPVATV